MKTNILHGLLFLFCVIIARADTIKAQEAVILAFVNEELITLHDFNQQVKIFQLLGILPTGEQVFDKNTQLQVTNNLITQRLKLQLSREQKSLPSRDELVNEKKDFAKKLNIAPNALSGYLQEKGIDEASIDHFLIVQLAWQNYAGKFFYRARPTVKEVDLAYQRSLNQLSQQQYLLDEIILAVGSVLEDNLKAQQASNIINQLYSGADFDILARNISDATTARQGGKRGWVAHGELPEALRQIIATMPLGSITSKPVRLQVGYGIYQLKDKRTPEHDYRQNLDYQLYTFGNGKKSQLYAAKFSQEGAFACQQTDKKSQYQQTDFSSDASLLPEILQNQLASLQEGQKSEAFFYEKEWVIIGLCARHETGVAPIKRDDIYNKIAFERLNQYVIQHFSQKRREAFIDLKL